MTISLMTFIHILKLNVFLPSRMIVVSLMPFKRQRALTVVLFLRAMAERLSPLRMVTYLGAFPEPLTPAADLR